MQRPATQGAQNEAQRRRADGRSGLRSTLANPQQRWALAGLAAAAAGTWLITTTLAIHVVAVAGADGVALLSLRFLAPAVAGPFAALPATRLAPRSALLLVGSGRTLVLGLAVVALSAGAPLWLVLVLGGLDGAVAAAARPAAAATAVAVARSPAELTGASAVASNVKTLAGISSAARSAACSRPLSRSRWSSAWGPRCSPFRRSRPSHCAHRGLGGQPTTARMELRRFAGGASAVTGNVDLRVVIACAATRSMIRAAWVALAVLAATGYLAMGESGVGILTAAAGAGAICSLAFDAALIASDRLAELLRRWLVVLGAALLVVAAFASLVVAVAAIAVWGLAVALVDMSASATLPRVAAGPQLARTIALTEAVKETAEGVAVACVPVTIALFGVRGGIVAWAAIPLVLAVVSKAKLRNVDEAARRCAHLLERVRGVALFASLRIVELSRIAGALHERAVAAGEVVIREGDPAGGNYFIVDAGELVVSIGGHDVAHDRPRHRLRRDRVDARRAANGDRGRDHRRATARALARGLPARVDRRAGRRLGDRPPPCAGARARRPRDGARVISAAGRNRPGRMPTGSPRPRMSATCRTGPCCAPSATNRRR